LVLLPIVEFFEVGQILHGSDCRSLFDSCLELGLAGG
jgi:hypothetical protein